VLARERVLQVAQCRGSVELWQGSLEARARVDRIRAKRGEPALRFFLQTVEAAAARRECVVHETFLQRA
jgi:hypothetical protein